MLAANTVWRANDRARASFQMSNHIRPVTTEIIANNFLAKSIPGFPPVSGSRYNFRCEAVTACEIGAEDLESQPELRTVLTQ